MGKHAKPDNRRIGRNNPCGLDKDGLGPVQDGYDNQALVDAWNIDAAYEKAKKKNEQGK